MADRPRDGETGDDARARPTAGISRWQKVVGIIGLLVILWVGNRILGNLLGRGHGPGGMHHGPGPDAPPAEIQERDTGGGHATPPGLQRR